MRRLHRALTWVLAGVSSLWLVAASRAAFEHTCTKYDNSVPAASNGSSDNGRVPLGTSGTGDDAHVISPNVMLDGDTYRMWYSGSASSAFDIFSATSSDGLVWTKVNNAEPAKSNSGSTDGRVPRGSSGGDTGHTRQPCVLKIDGVYWMWYSGSGGSPTAWRTYCATSHNAVAWYKVNNATPSDTDTVTTDGRMPPGTAGTGDDLHTLNPQVIHDGDVFKMWYAGNDGTWRTYYATSSNGLDWVKYDNTVGGAVVAEEAGKGDQNGALVSAVIKDGATYRMWYAGLGSDSKWRTYHATSTDGINWAKMDNTQADPSDTATTYGRIPLGSSGGDITHAIYASVLKEGGDFRIWYSGNNGKWRIYYATQEAPLPAISNIPAVDVTASTGSPVGDLTSTGGAVTAVSVYWGTSDEGTSKENWFTNDDLGVRLVGVVTNVLSDLTGGTRYYYRFYATNGAGEGWADDTAFFDTAGPPSVANLPVTDLTSDSATLRGTVLVGNPAPDLYICWGTNDVATESIDAWEHVEYAGTAPTGFSVAVGLLVPDTTYHYRCFATNANGGSWASTTTNFATLNGITRQWTGTGNWHTPANWSPAGVPNFADHAVIASGSVTLSQATTNGSVLVSSGTTLMFTNWLSKLEVTGDVMIEGTVTLPAAFTDSGPSNRVWITCSNFVLASGCTINGAAKGFQGGSGSGLVWGHGPGAGYDTWGGSHGGTGGIGGYGGAARGVYDSLLTPTEAGSGGGSHNGQTGGHGGGAVWIECTGDAVVNGTINVDGSYVRNQGGDGSGGAVYINARTCIGTNGLITADAGEGNYSSDTGGGGGGGGRIAVHVNASAQSNLLQTADSSLQFSADHAFGRKGLAGAGTVYLSDVGLWTRSSIQGGVYTIVGFDAWTVTNLSVSGGLASFPGVPITVVSNLTTSGRGGLELQGVPLHVTGDARFNADALGRSVLYGSAGAHLVVDGDLQVYQGNLYLDASGTNSARVHVGGDLVVTNGGDLFLYAGQTNATTPAYGMVVAVTGNVNVASTSVIYPYSHTVSGGSVLFDVANLSVAAGGTINGDGRGFGTPGGSGNAWGYGPGASYNGAGASYGGLGGEGRYAPWTIGVTYGLSNAPALPGSGGGRHNGSAGAAGGGLVRVVASGLVTLDGTITADGGEAASQGGSGSGGAVFIECYGFEGAGTGRIGVDGGATDNDGNRGGGGGGRVAVHYFSHNSFAGLVSVVGGIDTVDPPHSGDPGTIYFEQTGALSALDVAGSPDEYGNPTPQAYGTLAYAQGYAFTNSVEQVVDGPAGVKRYCTGWILATNSVSIDSGSTTQAVFQIPGEDAVLTWYWTNLYELAVTQGDHGGATTNVSGYYTNGLQVSISATAAVGYAFSQWSGDVPVDDLTDMPLFVTMDQPRSVQANFSSAIGETKTWTGSGSWTTATNWTPNGMPGPLDSAVIAGSCVLDQAVALQDVTVNGGATLTFSDWMSRLSARDVTVLSAGTVSHVACDTGATPSSNRVWIVCSNLTVATGAQIGLNARGFRGGVYEGSTQSYGQGPGAGSGSDGAAHGGVGGQGGYGNGRLGTYDSVTEPSGPGSGGGYHNSQVGGHGGGAVWINAAEHVLINGTITADGNYGGGQGGDGSGGSIYIACSTFAGTNALISADGGDGGGGGGGGGGGRIAIHYDTTAESNLVAAAGTPTVTISANHAYGQNGLSGPGTIYLPDTSIYPRMSMQGGELMIPTLTSWSPASLTVSGGRLVFPSNMTLSVTGSLTTTGRGGIELRGGSLDVGGNLNVTGDAYAYSYLRAAAGFAARVDGSLNLTEGHLYFYGWGESNSTLSIGADLALSSSADLHVLAGPTNGTPEAYGAGVEVGGDLDISGDSIVYVHSDETNGGSARFTAMNAYLAAGSTIQAQGRGFGGHPGTSGYYWGYGPGGGYHAAGGSCAGYGTIGGYGGTLGQTYGSSNAPVLIPGSGGGNHNTYAGTDAGGLVWIEVARTVDIDGTIDADGVDSSSANQAASGSGGSIYIRCVTFDGSGAALLTANGGKGGTASNSGGAGGGGQITISRRMHEYAGSVSVAGGDGYYPAAPGLYVLLDNPAPGTMFMVR